MQKWNNLQSPANYLEHNNWYSNMLAANIKTEPNSLSPTPHTLNPPAHGVGGAIPSTTHLENYLKQHQQEQFNAMDTNMNNNHQQFKGSGAGSEDQQKFYDTAGRQQQLMQQQQYQTHFQQAQQAAAQNQLISQLPLGFKPLTPPGLPQPVLPSIAQFYNLPPTQQQQTPSAQTLLDNSEKSNLTPRLTPPIDVTPPKSPKSANAAVNEQQQQQQHQDQELMSNCSEEFKYMAQSDDDENIHTPRYNSHGKLKKNRCRTCGLVFDIKAQLWKHSEIHMKPEKILRCHKCPFVTEYKHFFEYHALKHSNEKPFQCDKCQYSCVNKSMLNSHRKSHSSVYQYRCADCDYVTKYCHSLKQHLRKRDHKPDVVLDEDGTPNPSVVVDVYGSRRGPKNKCSSASSLKRSHSDFKMSCTSQLTPAFPGFMPNQMPASPGKSPSSVAATELSTLKPQLHEQQQSANGLLSLSPQPPQPIIPNDNMVATFLQFNYYWLAHQQAQALAQLSPHMREQMHKNLLNEPFNELKRDADKMENDNDKNLEVVEEEDEEEEDDDRKSVDSAMDLTHSTPMKNDEQKQTPADMVINQKLVDDNIETPLYSSSTNNRRKGRVLKLDHEQIKNNTLNSAPTSPHTTTTDTEMRNVASPVPESIVPAKKITIASLDDESMEAAVNENHNHIPSNSSNISASTSSGNSSNSSSSAVSSNNSTTDSSSSTTPAMFECKYCGILYKNAVLYTMHMGYHSCDDVFRCNMCGEKCDGPVGFFVHMARNAHS